jgi:HD-GYP domain-containing protein (c-di-GMP phosphodiesterase class II)
MGQLRIFRSSGLPLAGLAIPLSILLAFWAVGSYSAPLRSAAAVGGRADLSKGIDFDRGDLVRLDGEWEFYRGRLLGPGDFGGTDSASPALVAVPSLWSELIGFGTARLAPTGVGTIRLRLRLPGTEGEWALRLPNAISSTRVYVNGAAIAEIGRVSDRPGDFIPSSDLALPRFRSEGPELEIVMQVANFAAPMIGTWDSPILGSSAAILAKRQRDVASTSMIAGALLIMGLYHLGLFILRSKDRSSLLFGIICLLMTARNLIMGERLLLDIFPVSRLSWEWAYKLEHLSAHLTLPLFALFFKELFPHRVHRGAVTAILAGAGTWAALTLLAPAMIYQRFLHWYEYFLLVSALYLLATVAIAAIRRVKGARVVVAGMALILLTAVNDVLLSLGILHTFYMASYGVFLYIFTQSYHLSMLFSQAFRDVEDLSTRLLEQNMELESLHTIDLAIVSNVEQDGLLAVILEQALARLGMDAGDILLFEAKSEFLRLGARLGFRTDALLHTRLRAGEGYAGRALDSDRSVIVADLAEHAEGFGRSPAFAGEAFFFYAGRSLRVKGKIVGVLELYRRSPFRQYPSWELYFETLAGQAAVALDNSSLLQGLRRANEELLEANEATIEGWAQALELRDRETEGHSRRVTDMTMELARRFGISGPELDRIRFGSLLHDIGKMGVPDAILLKPGPLTEEEFLVMKRHPTIARDLLSRLQFLDRSLDIPYCHHEKWDGSGYPQGLAGVAIPLSARLFAVVDVWDALSSDRPYRARWPEERVLEHIASLAGSHFDPGIAEAFIALRRGAEGP